MATNFFGTPGLDIFVNQFTTVQFRTDNLDNPIGPPISPDIVLVGGGNPPLPIPVIFVTTFADIPAVDYSFSPIGVSIDLAANIPGQSLGLVASRPTRSTATLATTFSTAGSATTR